MGFEVSKDHTGSVSLPPTWGSDISSQLLLLCHAYLLAALFLAMVAMDPPSELVSKPPVKCFRLLVALVIVSLHSNKKVTKILPESG